MNFIKFVDASLGECKALDGTNEGFVKVLEYLKSVDLIGSSEFSVNFNI